MKNRPSRKSQKTTLKGYQENQERWVSWEPREGRVFKERSRLKGAWEICRDKGKLGLMGPQNKEVFGLHEGKGRTNSQRSVDEEVNGRGRHSNGGWGQLFQETWQGRDGERWGHGMERRFGAWAVRPLLL